MLIYDSGFMYLRQEYILPLSKYSVHNSSINANGIKNILNEQKYTNFRFESNQYVFEFDESLLLKAQLADAWKAYIRAIIQRDAACKNYIHQPDYCPNWSIVTDYYFAFFCACTILRLTFKGNMYIDFRLAKKISGFITDILGNPVKFPDGNIKYAIRTSLSYGKYELVIQKSDKSTHEDIWIQMAGLIEEIYEHAGAGTDEKLILTSFKSVFDVLGDNFPSSLRNEVNYQLQYGYLAITKSVLPANACNNKTGNWLTELLSYDNKTKTLPVRETRFCEYTEYLYRLMLNLEHQYREISGKGTSLLALINDKRSDKISEPEITYTD